MIRNLRQKFVIITMSLTSSLVLLLFMISNYYDNYWNNYDTYRLVKMVAQNDYLHSSSDEAIAMVTITNDKVSIKNNYTDLTDEEVKDVSRSLLKKRRKSWKWHDYVFQAIEIDDDMWRVVFIDMSSYKNTLMQTILTSVFTILGFCLLLGASIFLSRFIVQPAQDAIAREKQFVSDASHELKTPLAAIRANAQVLKNQIDSNRYLEHILSETKRMEYLVQNLLGLSGLEEGQKIEKGGWVHLSSICEEMLLNYESLAYEEGKLLDSKIIPGIDVRGQEAELKQLLAILLDNAIKYSLDKSTIMVDVSVVKKKAVLKVSNSSSTYSNDVLDKLFDRFYQAEGSRNKSDSFGLGLAIAKAIVEKHKGTIQVRQSHDLVTFEISFPMKK